MSGPSFSSQPFTPHSTAPDAMIVFFPFKNENTLELKDRDKIEVSEVVVKNEIISIATTKSKGGVGSWSCTLSPTQNWKSILSPGSWCMIYMSDRQFTGKESSELDSGLKMIGIVRSVRYVERVDPSTGVIGQTFQVSGEDFHAVLNTPIYLNVNLSEFAGGKDVSIASAILLLGLNSTAPLKPHEMIKSLVDGLLGKPAFTAEGNAAKTSKLAFQTRGGQPYLVPVEVAKRVLGFKTTGAAQNFFTGMLVFFLQQNLLGRIQIQSDIGGVVTTWSLLETYSNSLVNEIYTDLLPIDINGTNRLAPSLVFRAIPFSSNEGKKNIGHKSLISMDDATNGPIIAKRVAGLATSAGGGLFPVGPKVKGKKQKKVFRATPTGTASHFYTSKQIFEHEIMGFNSGKSDGERFNFFYVPPNITGGLKNQGKDEAYFLSTLMKNSGIGYNQILNKVSIARYGLRPYIRKCDYIVQDTAAIGIINRAVRDIWEPAFLFEHGNVNLIGNNGHIPVGTNIEFIERGWIAHVEKVDNTFEVSPSGIKNFRTNVTFTRLQKKGADVPLFSKPVDPVRLPTPLDDRKSLISSRGFGIV